MLRGGHASSQLSTMIKYIGKEYKICDMCENETYQNMYLDSRNASKRLFPEVDWKDLYICEKCAKRETGSKQWKTVKRNI